jgi:hypothetical protein
MNKPRVINRTPKCGESEIIISETRPYNPAIITAISAAFL